VCCAEKILTRSRLLDLRPNPASLLHILTGTYARVRHKDWHTERIIQPQSYTQSAVYVGGFQRAEVPAEFGVGHHRSADRRGQSGIAARVGGDDGFSGEG
jgi:hypothetical protein